MLSWLIDQKGAGSCSICKSPNTNKSTCPCNPDAKNPNYKKHPKCKSLIKKPKKAVKEAKKLTKQTKENKDTKTWIQEYGSNDLTFYRGILRNRPLEDLAGTPDGEFIKDRTEEELDHYRTWLSLSPKDKKIIQDMLYQHISPAKVIISVYPATENIVKNVFKGKNTVYPKEGETLHLFNDNTFTLYNLIGADSSKLSTEPQMDQHNFWLHSPEPILEQIHKILKPMGPPYNVVVSITIA